MDKVFAINKCAAVCGDDNRGAIKKNSIKRQRRGLDGTVEWLFDGTPNLFQCFATVKSGTRKNFLFIVNLKIYDYEENTFIYHYSEYSIYVIFT